MSPDPYRSRVDRTWEAAPRLDPVVHGGPDDGPLTEAQLERFARDGYLVLPGWFGREEAARARDEAFGIARERIDSDEVVTEPDSDLVRSVFAVHRSCSYTARLAADPRAAGVARQLLGSEVYLHQSRVNYKPPLDGREFFWHSDFETWHVEDGMPRMRAVSMSLCLSPSTAFNGPLMLIPGSHQTYVRCVGETPEDHYRSSLRRQQIGVPCLEALEQLVRDGGIVAPEGLPGSVIFFDCNTMHGSAGNLSPHPRTSLFLVFNSVHNALRDPFCGLAPRPEHIAARSAHPLARA